MLLSLALVALIIVPIIVHGMTAGDDVAANAAKAVRGAAIGGVGQVAAMRVAGLQRQRQFNLMSFTSQVRYWSRDILRWGKAYGVDPNLIAAVMQVESCGNPQAVSAAGALGLFQVMPFHFAAGEDPFDPDTNARRGIGGVLKQAMAAAGQGGFLPQVLAGYNGGKAYVNVPQSQWPAETRRYTALVEQVYAAALRKDTSQAARWAKSGLCLQAAQVLAARGK